MIPEGAVPVLDHGYLQLVETWGSDERIVEAARMSTGKGFNGWGQAPFLRCADCGYENHVADVVAAWRTAPLTFRCPALVSSRTAHTDGMMELREPPPGDEKLLRYLYTHRHETPFEMAGLVIEVQAPIFVFREWHRHRTQSYNEMSARYTPLPDVNYVPTPERCLLVQGANKQAAAIPGTQPLDHATVLWWLAQLESQYGQAQWLYERGLAAGIPKELARLPVPVARYSRMRASANLRNWLAFLTLRMSADAQWEIRQYANAVGELVAQRYPRTWALFCERKV